MSDEEEMTNAYTLSHKLFEEDFDNLPQDLQDLIKESVINNEKEEGDDNDEEIQQYQAYYNQEYDED